MLATLLKKGTITILENEWLSQSGVNCNKDSLYNTWSSSYISQRKLTLKSHSLDIYGSLLSNIGSCKIRNKTTKHDKSGNILFLGYLINAIAGQFKVGARNTQGIGL